MEITADPVGRVVIGAAVVADVLIFGLALLSVFVGAALQRTTGLGFALVCGPVLVLVLNPFDGIVLANLLSACVSTVVLLSTWRGIDRRMALGMSVGVVLGVPVGAWLVVQLAPAPLLVLVGGITSVAVALAFRRRPMWVLDHRGGPVVAGTVSGFSNVTAGVGGPALAVYGSSQSVPLATFVPTVQIVGLFTNLLSLAAKHEFHLPWQLVVSAVLTLFAGVAVGTVFGRKIPPAKARVLVLVLALVGGLGAVTKGVWQLLSA